jgi:NADPH2:quinone reductase
VNYAEIMARRHGYMVDQLPFIPGIEVAGYVHALGENVTGLHQGQPVAAFTKRGGYAEIAVAQADLTFPLDELAEPVELATAAGFPTVAPTAYDLLAHVARLQRGETVLIHAAAGGVGTVAGQLARHMGAKHVLGVVSAARKAAYARRFGYEDVFLREGFVEAVRAATKSHGVDVVLDAAGEPTRSQSLGVLAPFGRLVIYGNASGAPERPIEPGMLLKNTIAVMGYSITGLSAVDPQRVAATARQALALLATKQIRLDITDILPLEEAARAHRLIESGASLGKLLLKVA